MSPTSVRKFTGYKLSAHTPKLVLCLREGYSGSAFVGDLLAGLTVAIIALPLSMALGIASIPQSVADQLQAIHPWLTPPAMGLFTAVVAGFLVSALGGSRVQVGGPTAAFMPLVFGICTAHGYEGLAVAMCMAGVILLLLGIFRFGGVIKFVPYPVTAGFTAGIGVTILASQVRDFFGLTILTPEGGPASIPADFVGKMQTFSSHWSSFNWHSAAIGVGCLFMLTLMRRIAPRIPATVVAVAISAIVVHLFGWNRTQVAFDGTHLRPVVETIGTRFGGIPASLPAPHLPGISWSLVRELIPSASAIAFLGAIESLLSAVVADGMTGHRHRSDQELVAQGVSNIASAFFFGLPATGAIARTAANIRSGARTPVAGMLHAVFILLFMLALSPLAAAVPLASLAAILVMVAWKVSELNHFRALLRGPRPDSLVLMTTFGLTVFFDLTIAVGTGILLSSILFMRRMAQITTVTGLNEEIESGQETEAPDPKDPGSVRERQVPRGVEVYEVNGPFFFGVANNLRDALDQVEKPPKVLILRMRYVPHIDATGLNALAEFHRRCVKNGTVLLLGGVHAHPLFEMVKAGMDQQIGLDHIFDNLDDALVEARRLLGSPTAGAPSNPPTNPAAS